eukprot:MONOS_4655.1-p1 / transcript=MONOS_4655.1 / gene=MONOS_4655 / organism=Monocercomonoides_exilis_PA203 / gene_product=unspecified product / transcript_product=unspecified product / location=Mono_scaffold00126:40698-42874(-) / protein_length=494 / sequence_SO=supercontig / SO=protein_coding / is_pseudo=false
MSNFSNEKIVPKILILKKPEKIALRNRFLTSELLSTLETAVKLFYHIFKIIIITNFHWSRFLSDLQSDPFIIPFSGFTKEQQKQIAQRILPDVVQPFINVCFTILGKHTNSVATIIGIGRKIAQLLSTSSEAEKNERIEFLTVYRNVFILECFKHRTMPPERIMANILSNSSKSSPSSSFSLLGKADSPSNAFSLQQAKPKTVIYPSAQTTLTPSLTLHRHSVDLECSNSLLALDRRTQFLVLAAFLCSAIPSSFDKDLFQRHTAADAGRSRRKGGGAKKKKGPVFQGSNIYTFHLSRLWMVFDDVIPLSLRQHSITATKTFTQQLAIFDREKKERELERQREEEEQRLFGEKAKKPFKKQLFLGPNGLSREKPQSSAVSLYSHNDMYINTPPLHLSDFQSLCVLARLRQILPMASSGASSASNTSAQAFSTKTASSSSSHSLSSRPVPLLASQSVVATASQSRNASFVCLTRVRDAITLAHFIGFDLNNYLSF